MTHCLINTAGEIAARFDWDGQQILHFPDGWELRTEAECVGLAEAAPPPPKAIPVSPMQLRLWLYQQGLLTSVEGAIDGMTEPGRTQARIAWEYATEYRPDNPIVAALGAALGMTGDQVAAAFAAASQL